MGCLQPPTAYTHCSSFPSHAETCPLPYFPPQNKGCLLPAACGFSLPHSFSNQRRDFELKVVCHTESTTDPQNVAHVTPSGMILLLYTALGCWGTLQCVGIGGEKEMWSKHSLKILIPCHVKPPGMGRANPKAHTFAVACPISQLARS